jgi:hypothetical protein
VWGSSAGALVALLYCHGLSPHAIEQTGYDLYSGRWDLTIRPSTFQMLRHLVRDAILPADDATSAGFVDCTAGLQRMLAQYCDEIDPIRPFFCTAFNLDRARGEILTPGPIPPHLKDFLYASNAREAALASSSVPLLFVPRALEIEGRRMHYIDGSTTEGVPLWSVAKKWDLDRSAGVEPREKLTILYVKLGDSDMAHSFGGRMSKLRLLQTIATAGVETMFQRDLELLGRRGDVELLPLELLDPRPGFFETRRIPEFIRIAKETFPEQLALIEDQLRRVA